MTREITLIKREPPLTRDAKEELQWILESLGVPERFAEEYAELLIRIAKKREDEKISTSSLAEERGEKRTSLSYHINRMVAMGLITREGRYICLRASNFERMIEEIERDVQRMFEDLKKVAREVDELLGLPRR
ncbi:MAG TPA: hypothetical protein EYH23_00275 [Euryarchaeota archaeon]|nr:hypothetical protein [Euryarchaeota archaeon]HIQ09944.1 hypothetical protein [Euryarchaeota archaeon]